MTGQEKNNRKNAEFNGKANYEGVRDEYPGVHDVYSGVHDEYPGVGLNEEEEEPTVAPGMKDFLEAEASPEEVEKGEYTRVTRLTWDETH